MCVCILSLKIQVQLFKETKETHMCKGRERKEGRHMREIMLHIKHKHELEVPCMAKAAPRSHKVIRWKSQCQRWAASL